MLFTHHISAWTRCAFSLVYFLGDALTLFASATQPYTLVLIRHGESQWNIENRFTGWVDVPLAPSGVEESHRAAKALKEEGYEFDSECLLCESPTR